MSRDDFERCTPLEFYEVWRNWSERQERIQRSEWERTRAVVVASLQPHLNHAMTAHEIMPLPWDDGNGTAKPEDKEMSHEELQALFEETKKERGLR